MLRIFTPVKIQRLRPRLNPQTWVPEASMLTTRPPKPSAANGAPDNNTAFLDALAKLRKATDSRFVSVGPS